MVAEATGDHLKMGKLEAERIAEAKKKEEAAKLAASVITRSSRHGASRSTTDSREKIVTCEDLKELKAWLLNAATAETPTEVFAKVVESGGH